MALALDVIPRPQPPPSTVDLLPARVVSWFALPQDKTLICLVLSERIRLLPNQLEFRGPIWVSDSVRPVSHILAPDVSGPKRPSVVDFEVGCMLRLAFLSRRPSPSGGSASNMDAHCPTAPDSCPGNGLLHH